VFLAPDTTDIVALALAEDLGLPVERFLSAAAGLPDMLGRDVTSSSVIGLDARFRGRIVARESCVVAGLPVVDSVYRALSAGAGLPDPVEVFPLVAEGARVDPGTAVAEVEGIAVAVLAGERTALDFLMALSGMATETAKWVELAGPDLAVCDTRKTSPGLRALSKYAVLVGGGTNHRRGLDDMVLIKDNHIRHAGGITAAVASARAAHPELLVQVEADSLAQSLEAVSEIRSAASALGISVLTEASGNVRAERIPALRATGVDRVSSSALTLGMRVIDFGLDES
jgi:nicotinate-nucleotide pyrophosphorylase (carboxylating)